MRLFWTLLLQPGSHSRLKKQKYYIRMQEAFSWIQMHQIRGTKRRSQDILHSSCWIGSDSCLSMNKCDLDFINKEIHRNELHLICVFRSYADTILFLQSCLKAGSTEARSHVLVLIPRGFTSNSATSHASWRQFWPNNSTHPITQPSIAVLSMFYKMANSL